MSDEARRCFKLGGEFIEAIDDAWEEASIALSRLRRGHPLSDKDFEPVIKRAETVRNLAKKATECQLTKDLLFLAEEAYDAALEKDMLLLQDRLDKLKWLKVFG